MGKLPPAPSTPASLGDYPLWPVPLTDLLIPGMNNNQTANLLVYKSGGQIEYQLNPLIIDAEGYGKTRFQAGSGRGKQTLDATGFTAWGNLTIYDEATGKDVKLKGYLDRLSDLCRITIPKWQDSYQHISFGGGTSMKILEGLMPADLQANEWTRLAFTAEMVGFADMGDDRIMDFVVDGAINADGQGVEVTNIETPFGDLNLYFNFIEPSLRGHMSINGLTLGGGVGINQGSLNLLFDSKGFEPYAPAKDLHFLAMSADGSSTVNIVVTYSDNTTEQFGQILNY